MKELTVKLIHLARKNGEGILDIAKKYELSEKEVREFIHSTVGSANGATQLINALEKNDKANKRRKVKKQLEAEETAETEATEEPTATEETEEPEPLEEIEHPEQQPKQATLAELKAQEEELSASLIALESSHKVLVEERRVIVARIREIGDQLGEIQQKAQELKEVLIAESTRYNEVAQEMTKLNPEIVAHRDLLQETREKISELSKPVIVVYDDGSLEAENAEIPEVSNDYIQEKLAEILEIPEAENLTLRQMKALARLYFILRVINVQNVEVAFENETAKEVFEKINY